MYKMAEELMSLKQQLQTTNDFEQVKFKFNDYTRSLIVIHRTELPRKIRKY